MADADSYMVYVRIYGRLACNGKLTQADYGDMKDGSFVEHAVEIQMAISMAAQDVVLGARAPIRSRKDLGERVRALLG